MIKLIAGVVALILTGCGASPALAKPVANTTQVVTARAAGPVQEALKVVSLGMEASRNNDGSQNYDWQDIYIGYSRPVKDVYLTVFKRDTGAEVTSYKYPERLMSAGQTTFALAASRLTPGSDYTYLIWARDVAETEAIGFKGTFRTAGMPPK